MIFMVLCKCKICGRIFDSAHSGSYSYCSQSCIDDYKMKRYMAEREAYERKQRLNAERDDVFNRQIRGSHGVASTFKFRRTRGST
jgi:hypothetical protein